MPAHWTLRDNQNIEEYVNELRQVTEERHSVINFFSLAKYGTVEFRQFQGTINKVKIMNWMKLTERFCARTSDRKYKNHSPLDYPQTIDGMCDFLGFGKYGVRRWARSRALSNGFAALAIEYSPEVINPISGPANRPTVDISTCNNGACSTEVDENAFLGYCQSCLASESREIRSIALQNEIRLHMENDEVLYNTIRIARETRERANEDALSAQSIDIIVTNWQHRYGALNYSSTSPEWDGVNWNRLANQINLHELC